MDDPAAARQALADALEIVLPGRVYAHPPTTRRYVTPSLFIEQPQMTEALQAVLATFPVWVVVDGAVQAQIALLDDLCWNAWLACAPLADSLRVRPTTLGEYRAAVVEVDVVVGVETLCGLGVAQTVAVPPQPIGRREQ